MHQNTVFNKNPIGLAWLNNFKKKNLGISLTLNFMIRWCLFLIRHEPIDIKPPSNVTREGFYNANLLLIIITCTNDQLLKSLDSSNT